MLSGFMGAGKSTVGPLVAARLGWRFVDVDNVLEGRTGLRVAEIFAKYGEAHFRSLEESAVAELLTERAVVLALGGGALESAATRAALAAAAGTHVVFLDVPYAIAIERCRRQPDAAERPVLHAGNGGGNRLSEESQVGPAARYRTRLPVYRTAHQTVDTATLSAEQAAQRIAERVRPPAPAE